MNNRQHPRYAIELDAQIVIGDLVVSGRTRDISRGGFCVLASEQVPVHSECEIRLALVFSQNEFSEQLALPATVVWCTRLKQGHQIGIKFGALDEQMRGYLNLFVDFLDREEDDDEEEPPQGGRTSR